jgi:hypothetical protein
MNEDRFNELMRDAAQTYRTPPVPDFDDMWKEIEARATPSAFSGGGSQDDVLVVRPPTAARRSPRWLAIAATLVIGIGVGRVSATISAHNTMQPVARPAGPAVAAARVDSGPANTLANSYEVETSKYLDQTAALLIALPSEVKSGRANEQFVGRAGELLTTTRLLIDSPASDDPQMRNLLEDLELVLAQVVRLQNTNSRTELDLINRALEQRDVLPRLRTAVATNIAN